MRAPHSPGHAWPRLPEGEDTLDIVAMDLLARDGVDDGRVDSEERKGGGAGLRWCDTSKGSNDVGTSLGLPICLCIRLAGIR